MCSEKVRWSCISTLHLVKVWYSRTTLNSCDKPLHTLLSLWWCGSCRFNEVWCETRCAGCLCTSLGCFKHIEPHRTYSNHNITEIARCVEVCHEFGVVRPYQNFSINIIKGKTRCAGCLCTSFVTWVRGGSTVPNLLWHLGLGMRAQGFDHVISSTIQMWNTQLFEILSCYSYNSDVQNTLEYNYPNVKYSGCLEYSVVTVTIQMFQISTVLYMYSVQQGGRTHHLLCLLLLIRLNPL